jgi:Tat protein translocase TatB subunit
MCGISGFELVVILAAAIIFLGPERLPDMMRAVGRLARELRRLRGDLGQVTREITSQVGVDDLKDTVRETLNVDRVRSRMKDAESEIDAIRARLKRPAGVEEVGVGSPPEDEDGESGGANDGPTIEPETLEPVDMGAPAPVDTRPTLTPAELHSSNPAESLVRPVSTQPEERLAAALGSEEA